MTRAPVHNTRPRAPGHWTFALVSVPGLLLYIISFLGSRFLIYTVVLDLCYRTDVRESRVLTLNFRDDSANLRFAGERGFSQSRVLAKSLRSGIHVGNNV